MLNDDQGAGGAVEPKDDSFSVEELNPTNDPYDNIEDDEARNEAKKMRAIARRQDRKVVEPVPVVAVTPEVIASNFATKDDLKLMATNAAKEKVAPEVKALWDELVAIPLGGFDPMSAESIAANMQKRYGLYKYEHPEGGSNPTADLTSSPELPLGGTTEKSTKATEIKLPNYREPVGPSEWYK